MVRSPVNTAPSVTPTGPAPGTVYQAGDSIPLSADAADEDGFITKVDFYQGTTLLGSSTEAPYAITWDNAPAGSYTITVKATDDRNGTREASLPVAVNAPPEISLSAPAGGAVAYAPADLSLSVTASDPDGQIVKVEFYQGNTLLGTASSAPYAYTWSGAPAGNYSLSAIAYDNQGGQTASTPVLVIVDALPQVNLTATVQGSAIAPATVNLASSTTDSDGQVTRVDFYQGTTLIGTSGQAPYSFTWNGVQAGNYSLTAQAMDDRGGVGVSTPVSLTIAPNLPPQVTLTAPTAGQSFPAQGNVSLTANASDADGTIVKVEFYQGDTLIGSVTQTPFVYTWSAVPAGSYSLTAKATDDKGATTSSVPVSISVTAGMAHGIFYIHPDHLGTPRAVTDDKDKVVWQNDLLGEPFGNTAPDEDPDGDGRKFELNLRFPGQYYDRESGLHYNYFRDYDPSTGRYVEADPVGLAGGINLYGYVGG